MNYLCSVAYDGSKFHGLAKQPELRTVQGHLVDVLNTIFQDPPEISFHSRTDRGVHAMDQKIQIRLNTKIPPQRLPRVINPKLKNLRINWIESVYESFDITNVKIAKVYQYRILWSEPFPFHLPYAWLPGGTSPDIMLFTKAMELYQGKHNFVYLCKRDRSRNIQDFYRKIESCNVEAQDSEWIIKIQGSGFLWGMVRHMVSYAMACAAGKLSLEDLALMLCGPDSFKGKKPSIKPAPAAGLYLLNSRILD